jgi:hypothetical protein
VSCRVLGEFQFTGACSTYLWEVEELEIYLRLNEDDDAQPTIAHNVYALDETFYSTSVSDAGFDDFVREMTDGEPDPIVVVYKRARDGMPIGGGCIETTGSESELFDLDSVDFEGSPIEGVEIEVTRVTPFFRANVRVLPEPSTALLSAVAVVVVGGLVTLRRDRGSPDAPRRVQARRVWTSLDR